MHEVYDGLRSKLSSALKEINRTGKLNGAALDELHTITDTIKNIDKIQMLENDGYSQDGGRWEANGSYDSRNSYANRRGSNYVKRLLSRRHNAQRTSRQYVLQRRQNDDD